MKSPFLLLEAASVYVHTQLGAGFQCPLLLYSSTELNNITMYGFPALYTHAVGIPQANIHKISGLHLPGKAL